MIAPTRFPRCVLVFLGVLAAAVGGCGGGTGTVEGKVTVDGKPAVGAAVIFSGGDNQSATALVQEDGSYQTAGVPVGPVKVVLMANMGGMGMGRAPMPKGMKGDKGDLPIPALKQSPAPPIPKQYTNVATSGLTLTVKGGRNEYNIEMNSH
jgi:hypothetical protein